VRFSLLSSALLTLGSDGVSSEATYYNALRQCTVFISTYGLGEPHIIKSLKKYHIQIHIIKLMVIINNTHE